MLVCRHEENPTSPFDWTCPACNQHLCHLVVVVGYCKVQPCCTWIFKVKAGLFCADFTCSPRYSSPSTLSKADLGKFFKRRRAILVWIGLSQMMRTWSRDSPEKGKPQNQGAMQHKGRHLPSDPLYCIFQHASWSSQVCIGS